MAKWAKEHSAGAFVKKIGTTLVGSALTSFTGGLTDTLSTAYADRLVRKIFSGSHGSYSSYQPDE